MILIVGGVFQGKRELAKRLWAEGNTGEPRIGQLLEEDDKEADIIADYHLYIRTLLEQGKDAAAKTEELLEQNPNLILTMAELGCGIVPMEAFEREWRETTGRIGCFLAAQAEAVYRVSCGVEQKIK